MDKCKYCGEESHLKWMCKRVRIKGDALKEEARSKHCYERQIAQLQERVKELEAPYKLPDDKLVKFLGKIVKSTREGAEGTEEAIDQLIAVEIYGFVERLEHQPLREQLKDAEEDTKLLDWLSITEEQPTIANHKDKTILHFPQKFPFYPARIEGKNLREAIRNASKTEEEGK